MRSFIFLLALVLGQNTLSHAQESPCYGVTAEIGTVQPRLSSAADVKGLTCFSIGGAYYHPFGDRWAVNVEAAYGSSKISGKAYSSLTSFSTQTLDLKTFSVNSNYIYILDEAQRFKVGLGVFADFALPSQSKYASNIYFASSAKAEDKYYLSGVFKTAGNQGLSALLMYNIKNAFQVGLRYKFALASVYDQTSNLTWKQNSLGLNLTYYFGTEPTRKSSNSKEKDKYKY